ncbi:MAG: thermopsin family protease [Thermoplasmata archaeon]
MIAVLGWMGLDASAAMGSATNGPSSHSLLNPHGAPDSGSGTALAAGAGSNLQAAASSGPFNAGATMAAKALAATKAAGLKPDVVYVPRPSATPAQVAEAKQKGATAPLYLGYPAPMGIADYGLSVNGKLFVANLESDNVTVINGTSNLVIANVNVGSGPIEAAYDYANGNVYVTDLDSNAVSVIDGVTNLVIATVEVGVSPYGVAVDPTNGDVYVANKFSNNVSVISGTTNKVVATIPVGSSPVAVAYDSEDEDVYVTNDNSSTVSVISGANNLVVDTLGVGANPGGLAYDFGNDEIFVTNYGSNNVSVINGGTRAVVTNIPVGAAPFGEAYDDANGEVYVADLGSTIVSVIDGAYNKVVASVNVGISPAGVAVDGGDGDIYVTNYNFGGPSWNVSVIDGTTNLVVDTVGAGDDPVGIAFDGGNQAGPLAASVLNTTSLQGYVDANATGIQGEDLYQSSPDSFSIQLNAVLTNVTLFGNSSYQFWTQDVITYFPATDYMILVSNVWNFSGPNASMTNNSIYSHGPDGTDDYGTLGFYYANYTVGVPITYPFNAILTMSSSVVAGRNVVSFSTSVFDVGFPTDSFDLPSWDTVTFNSVAPGPHPVHVGTPGPGDPPAPVANFTASGSGYNDVGLLDDFELVVVGPGGGSQVDLGTADATLGLAFNSDGTYLPIPSAYNYGSDTGETSTGANVEWSQSGVGPDGLGLFANMTTGPSIMSGLWATGAPEGSVRVQFDVNPTNSFIFLRYAGLTGVFTTNFIDEFVFVPTMSADTFYLEAGSYQVFTFLSYYDPSNLFPTFTTSTVYAVNLTRDASFGTDTPLWAFSNSQLAAISQSGTGTPSNPYILDNAPSGLATSPGQLGSDFGLYNDYEFPVFPGVFLKGTTDSVELNNSTNFNAVTNTLLPMPGYQLPPSNDLQLWFWGVSNVDLHNDSNISGWFGRQNFFPLTYNSFNVIFYASEDNLVANNNFLTQGEGLLMYASGADYYPFTTVGGNNTVWGNKFFQVDPPLDTSCPGPGACLPLLPYNSGLGIEIGEGYDTIYNNLVATPTTAWLLPLNLESEGPYLWTHNVWNIPTQPATNVLYASGFPTIPLTGSIVNGTTQGGNSWWDYGVTQNWANGANNTLGVLPYVENANSTLDPLPGFGSPLPGYSCLLFYCSTFIYGGGDFAPLATAAETVTLGPHGLISGTVWGATVSCAPPHNGGGGPPSSVCCGPPHNGGGGPPGCNVDPPAIIFAHFTTKATLVDLVLPDGTFNWTPIAANGYTSSSGGSFNVTAGEPVTIVIPYAPPNTGSFVFSERGLAPGLLWSVKVGSTTQSLTTDGGTDSLAFSETPSGGYPYTVTAISGWDQTTLAYSGTVTGGAVSEPTLVYKQAAYSATFTESGLPSLDTWYVNITGGPSLSGTGATTSLFASLPNGSYPFTVATNDMRYSASGFTPNPFVLKGASVSLSGTFSLIGYLVTFTESGLPTGDLWYVNISGGPSLSGTGAGTTLSTSLADGSYAYTVATNDKRYAPSAFAPNPIVVSGHPVTASGSFSLQTSSVTFTETGLSSGTSWSVTLGASTLSSTGTTITFREPNGTYAFTVGPVSGYNANPSSGSIRVAGIPVNQPITFAALALSVTPGQGPVGATVTVAGTGFTASSTLKSLVFDGVTISWCTSGSLTVSATGTFSCTFLVPHGTSGSIVTATDVSGLKVSGAFTVTTPKLTVNPMLGPIGATVTVSGTGFSVSSLVHLSFDRVTISSCTTGSFTTSAAGSFSCTFRVPTGTSGTAVTATDVGGSTAGGFFLVTVPVIAIFPGQGPVGATVTVAGIGFSVLSPVSLVFDGVKITSCTSGSLVTNSLTIFGCTFKVPSGTSGTTVTATDVGGQKALGSFKVTVPSITVSPGHGVVGSTVTVSGTGFSTMSRVSLVFDGVSITRCITGSLMTNAKGAFSCTFRVPSDTSGTTVSATDIGGQVALAKFTVP